MKNKLPIIVLSVFLFFIVGAIALYLQVNKTTSTKKENTVKKNLKQQTIKNEENTREETITGSLLDILNLDKSIKCSFSFNDKNNKNEGTTYVSGNKVRVENIISYNNQEIITNIISDGEYFYSWGSSLPNQGFKMKVEKTKSETNLKGPVENQEAFKSIEQEYEYKCLPWIADNSKFVAPSNITFTDFSDTIQNLTKTMPNLCESCDSIEDNTAKEQCKIQLKCN